jgi:hypothetical protein
MNAIIPIPRCAVTVRPAVARVVDPIIATGNGKLQIHGEIKTGQYLCYTAGDIATVLDENRKKVIELPITRREYRIPCGFAPAAVSLSKDQPAPWLEVQFTVEGTALRIAGTERVEKTPPVHN